MSKNWFYSFVFGSRGTCTYCGGDGVSQDHVIPVSWFRKVPVRGSTSDRRGIRTWSCTYCNSVLSNNWFDTFSERCSYVESSYRRKYRRILGLDTWDEVELAELSGKLRSYVELQNSQRIALLELVEWNGSDSFYYNIEDLLWQPTVDVTSPYYSSTVADFFGRELKMINSICG